MANLDFPTDIEDFLISTLPWNFVIGRKDDPIHVIYLFVEKVRTNGASIFYGLFLRRPYNFFLSLIVARII